MSHKISILFFALILFTSCATKNTDSAKKEVDNPAAEGFNQEGSDSLAIAIADEVMNAMGGRTAWDTTRYFTWNFFGRRDLIWDKKENLVKIISPGDSLNYFVNLQNKTGKIYKNGIEITDPELKDKLIDRGYRIWVNDSYWLVMPFKLKDSGVTLTYVGEDTTLNGSDADVLQLTFDQVGVTPQNKYRVWVDQSDNLVKQWAYYAEASQDTASAIWPWDNYSKFGSLMLSSDRSDGRGPKNVNVNSYLPDSIFQALMEKE